MRKTFRRLASKIERDTLRTARIARENREKILRCEFEYHMKLVRAEMFEEFHEKKRKLELDWCKRLEIQKQNHCKSLERLKESMEMEYMQNLTDLKVQYEEQNVWGSELSNVQIQDPLSSPHSVKSEERDDVQVSRKKRCDQIRFFFFLSSYK